MLDDGKTAVIDGRSQRPCHGTAQQAQSHAHHLLWHGRELIKAALDGGREKIIIGIGGSATNEGGMGMMKALGMEFFDKDGNELGTTAQDMLLVCICTATICTRA